jgi:2-C-methyl-D-erythritol 4-phosphate cytidylyltransferase
MKRYAIIVAGGSGSRMNADIPKQFILLKGLPILMHTINRFYNFNSSIHIILVLPQSHIANWEKLCKEHNFTLKHQIVSGGETRFHSVKNGLDAITETNVVVGIHDGVRPFVSNETLSSCFGGAEKSGNAVPSVAVSDSMRMVENAENSYLDRNQVKIIQTPQCFQIALLKKAFLQNYSPSFTDDATVVEAIGEKVNLVEGNSSNIKITTPYDLKIAEVILSSL